MVVGEVFDAGEVGERGVVDALGEGCQGGDALLAGWIAVVGGEEVGDGEQVFAPDGQVEAAEAVGGGAQAGDAGQVAGLLVEQQAVELAFGEDGEPGAAQVPCAEEGGLAAFDFDVFLLSGIVAGFGGDRAADFEVPEAVVFQAGDDDATRQPDGVGFAVVGGGEPPGGEVSKSVVGVVAEVVALDGVVVEAAGVQPGAGRRRRWVTRGRLVAGVA